MRSRSLVLLGYLLLAGLGLFAVACGDDDASSTQAEGDESPDTRATRTVLAGAGQPPPRTEDGYDIVFATQGPQTHRSRPGERAAERQNEHLVREPTEPDPDHGTFTLDQAVEGLPIDGQLVAEINTDLGTVFCDLYADRAPNTVANFVGLARGRRAWWDARAAAWVRRPAYSMTKFHRVVPEFMIQGGDYLGDGTGDPGYAIPDELHPTLSHDRAGQLCMANLGPNKNGAQFFITDGRAPQLDGSYTIFGQCQPTEIVEHIARVPQREEHPLTDVVIERVLIRRVDGGAAVAHRSQPRLPEGFNPDAPARGASPGPSEQRARWEEHQRLLEEAGRIPPSGNH